MALYDNRSLAFRRPVNTRPDRNLGPIGKRVLGLLLGTAESNPQDAPGELPGSVPDEAPTAEHRLRARFPLVLRGYDRATVDDYVAELEQELFTVDRELAAIRGGSTVADEVANELKRIGEQTSAVLMTAHQQRDEIVRQAQEEAQRCVAEATATANALTAKTEQRLRELNAQNTAAQTERVRLLEDLREISAALVDVADSADERAGAHSPVA